jgi:hydroxymethylpyrimidine/phosphomethylpyrimidine kinase
MNGRVLVVAGSDSGGGAGIQADIKTVTALGGYAATAVTALTAQNTLGVLEILPVPAAFVRRQMEAVLDDIGADCIKTGVLYDAAVIAAVADTLDAAAPVPLVVDPVMVSTSGTPLLDARAVEILNRRLIGRATVVTPNAPEAEALTGLAVTTFDDRRRAADRLLALGAGAVLLKGGHVRGGGGVEDLLVEAGGATSVFVAPRQATRHTHGTGCTLASAIAVGLAQGLALRPAVDRAHAYLQEAIRTAPGYGGGHGPLNHGHTVAGA